jgi:sugar (pentulose or hexulose) kinase
VTSAVSKNAPVVVAGADLGASGGRVIAARVSRDGVELRAVSRFPNEPVFAGGTLYWDILRLYAGVLAGLAAADREFGPLASAGIDSWACDYGLLDSSGALLGNPVHYRDSRTTGVTLPVTQAELYAATGIQHQPFNTVYQLAAAAGTPALAAAQTLLLVPDLLAYWLTGSAGAEVTNASTTALLHVSTRAWAAGLMERAGIRAALFPPLRQPGDVIGPITGIEGWPGGVPLIAVGSHDTASAVAAVPASGEHFAYISSGTWSLVGMELPSPVLSRESRLANFTNEAGIDGTVRYLRNVSGLWLLQECMRCWGVPALHPLLAQAAAEAPLRFVIDPDDPVFLPLGGDMPARIATWLSSRGLPVPSGPAQIVRCVLDSLALAYRRAVLAVQELSGRHADVVHIVGGGSRNELLCQLTADATGLPVVAGPAEATALGNVLVQARALGAAPGSLAGMRALLGSCVELRRFVPSGRAGLHGTPGDRAWTVAAQRLGGELAGSTKMHRYRSGLGVVYL